MNVVCACARSANPSNSKNHRTAHTAHSQINDTRQIFIAVFGHFSETLHFNELVEFEAQRYNLNVFIDNSERQIIGTPFVLCVSTERDDVPLDFLRAQQNGVAVLIGPPNPLFNESE